MIHTAVHFIRPQRGGCASMSDFDHYPTPQRENDGFDWTRWVVVEYTDHGVVEYCRYTAKGGK